jgi:hypothetical protein
MSWPMRGWKHWAGQQRRGRLKQALGIRTVGELTEHRLVRRAQAIVTWRVPTSSPQYPEEAGVALLDDVSSYARRRFPASRGPGARANAVRLGASAACARQGGG